MANPNTGNASQCTATCANGQRCTRRPVRGLAQCFTHAPELAAERHAAAQRGGRNRARVIRLQRLVPPRLVDVYDQLEAGLARLLAGELDPRVALAAATLADAMVKLLAEGSVEEQLKALERQGAVEPPTPFAGRR